MFYTYYGFNITTDIALPFLPTIASPSCDLTIITNAIPLHFKQLPALNLGLHYDHQHILLTVHDIARYAINHNTIIVEPYNNNDQESISHFLIQAAIPYWVLLQNKKLILRGGAFVADDGTANLILGDTGSGKSVLLSALCQGGAKLLSDQFCVIGYDHNHASYAEPGYPGIALWPDTRAALDKTAVFSTIRTQSLRKNWLLSDAHFQKTALPISTIFILESQNLDVHQLRESKIGAQKFDVITQYQFGECLSVPLQLQKNQFQMRMNLVKHCMIDHLTRLNDKTTAGELKAMVTLRQRQANRPQRNMYGYATRLAGVLP